MSAAVMVLEPRLDLRATGPLVEALIARRGEDLALDAGAVTQIGALSVQALRAGRAAGPRMAMRSAWRTPQATLPINSACSDSRPRR
jgi:hypothetical protein